VSLRFWRIQSNSRRVRLPVLRELRLHELAEYTVPAVAASGAQSLDSEHR
jgi:hypothetical protein